jgi:hypothetical protein
MSIMSIMSMFKSFIFTACAGLLLAPASVFAFTEGFQYTVTGSAASRTPGGPYTLSDSIIQFLGNDGTGTHVARVELNGQSNSGAEGNWEFFFSYNPAQLNSGVINLSTLPDANGITGNYLQTGTANISGQNYLFAQNMDSKIQHNATRLSIWFGAFLPDSTVRQFHGDYHLSLNRNTGTEIPEPMTMSLLAAGLLGGAMRKRKTSKVVS